MTSDRSALLESLVAQLELLPPSQWAAQLERATDDPHLRAEVRRRLTQDDADSGPMSSPLMGPLIAGVAALLTADRPEPAAVSLIGRRIGAYEITGTIGHGGMGAVYRARRVDGQLEQDVAIKLVRHGFETPTALDRFRRERQFLARLTDAGVARFLDGGTTRDENGRDIPYLVMEYVDGQSITRYCDAHRLPVADRVRLFRRVCEAVQHAHQQLIVHRDLKPGNILITGEGHPKLLDFGIATLLGADGLQQLSLTSTGMQNLTPDYASPEQVRGEPVTVATDIYSLGAVLYELLTGRKAHQFHTHSPVEIARVICDSETSAPSAAVPSEQADAARIRRQLEGDLDTIILKALAKDPLRRYATVERFSEDLRLHLDGLPVLARPDTVVYRAAKFVRRHRLSMAAAVVVAASLVVGTTVSIWQARRAERRFDQVQKLANSLIYEIHDSIRDLTGSTKARQAIVTTAVEYLGALEREAGGDEALTRDLAAGYLRIGDVQGGVLGSNLGDVQGALESYQRARTLLERSATAANGARQLAAVDVKMGDALSYHGDLAAAMTAYARAQSLMQPVVAAPTAHPDDVLQLATVFQGMARVQGLSRAMTDALASSEQVLALRLGLATRDPGNLAWRDSLAGAEAEVSMALQRIGRPKDALPHANQALAARKVQAREQPNNVAAQRSLILAYSHVADVMGNPTMPSLGDTAGAIALYREMTAIAERLRAADASDRRAELDLANCLLRLGSAQLASPDRHEGIQHLERSAALMRELAAAEPKNNRVRVTLAFVYGRLGDALAASGRPAESLDRYQDAIAVSDQVLAADPAERSIAATLALAHGGRGLVLAQSGRRDAALRAAAKGLEVLDHARATQPGNPRILTYAANGYATMARIHAALGTAHDRSRQCFWLQKSSDQFDEVDRSGGLDHQGTAERNLVVSELVGCRP